MEYRVALVMITWQAYISHLQ